MANRARQEPSDSWNITTKRSGFTTKLHKLSVAQVVFHSKEKSFSVKLTFIQSFARLPHPFS